MSSVEWFGPEKPTLGPVENGKQTVQVMYKDGMSKTYLSTPDKVDEFVSQYKNIEKRNTKKQWLTIISGTALGSLLAFAKDHVNYLKDISKKELGIGGALLGLAAGSILACCMTPQKKQEKLAQQMFENQ